MYDLLCLQVEFAEGSPLSGQQAKIFIGATHIHFGPTSPLAGQTPNRVPPQGLAFKSLPGQAKQQETTAVESVVKKPAAIATGPPAGAAAAAAPSGTRSPSKRQAALAAPAHWAAAGIPTAGASAAAAKRPAAAAAAAGSKKPRVSGNGNLAQHSYGMMNLAGVGGGLSQQQRQIMMYAAHAQQMMGADGVASGYGHDRRLGRPPSAGMVAEPQSKTSRFRWER